MPSYTPEHTYGLIPGTYDQFGLIPWPAHLKPRESAELTKKGEVYVERVLGKAGGVRFITIDLNSRKSIGDAIDRLIDMLDVMEPDPDLEEQGDLEPSLGWTEGGRGTAALDRKMIQDDREAETEHDEDGGDDEPTLGAAERHASPYSSWNDRDRTGDQTHWAEGEPWGDEREDVSEDEGAQCDDEGELDVDAPGLIWGGNEDGKDHRA